MKRRATHVIALAALISCPILAAGRPAPAQAPTADQPIGLPRVSGHEPIRELRDIHFDFGEATIRPGDVKILDANAAWLRAHPQQLLLIEGHCDNRGTTSRKNDFNVDLGEQRAQAAMNHLVAPGGERGGAEPHHHLELWRRAAAVHRGERTVLEPEPAVALPREAALEPRVTA